MSSKGQLCSQSRTLTLSPRLEAKISGETAVLPGHLRLLRVVQHRDAHFLEELFHRQARNLQVREQMFGVDAVSTVSIASDCTGRSGERNERSVGCGDLRQSLS